MDRVTISLESSDESGWVAIEIGCDEGIGPTTGTTGGPGGGPSLLLVVVVRGIIIALLLLLACAAQEGRDIQRGEERERLRLHTMNGGAGTEGGWLERSRIAEGDGANGRNRTAGRIGGFEGVEETGR